MSTRYWEARDGWHFNYSTEPTHRCPAVPERDGDGRWVVTPAIVQAAELLGGLDPYALARRIGSASHGHRKRDDDGKLITPARCEACGARLELVGYRAHVERPVAPDEDATGERITRRLGWQPMRTVKSVMLDTRREAKAWAYDEYRTHRNALQEATA